MVYKTRIMKNASESRKRSGWAWNTKKTPHSPHFAFGVDYSTNGMKIDCVATKGAFRAYFGQYPKCTPE